jgi:regulatory protein
LAKKITRLAYQTRNKERVNVYLDGEFAFGLALAEAIRLKVGQELSEGDVEALQRTDSYHRAYQRALDYLSRRPRSCQEIRRYLSGKELPEEEIQRVIDRLLDLGFLDDLAFARYWIENRDTFRPRGAMAIRYELRQKGVDGTIIDEALQSEELNEVESAYRVARKRLPRLRDIQERREFQEKLAAYLSRRGFRWETIREVSEQLWKTREDDQPDI